MISAAFVLAFEPRPRWLSILVTGMLGVGSGLILDEVVYLIATPAVTDENYKSAISLGGSIVCLTLATVFLVLIYRLSHKQAL